MKSFEEFWKTLTQDDFISLIDFINDANKELEESSLPQQILGNQIAMTSMLSTRFMLGKYHKWLSEQL